MGPAWPLRAAWQRLAVPALAPVLAPLARRAIEAAVASRPKDRWLVVVAPLDWRFPYGQRTHHLVRALRKLGQPMIYVSRSTGYDRVSVAAREDDGFIVTPHREAALAAVPRPLVYVTSTDAHIDAAMVETVRRKGGTIIYDYVDAIDDRLSTGPITAARYQVHRDLLEDETSTVCVASAASLSAEVSAAREKGFALVRNGVDVAHFQAERSQDGLRPDFAAVVRRGRPIVGYFGALAEWLDYEWIRELARRTPGDEIVLVGIDLDGSVQALRDRPANLHVLGPVPYRDLPRHAVWFDVGLIPFRREPVTDAASPLKLFEYMALGVPIVSTDLPECRAFPCVGIARSLEEAVALVDRGLVLRTDPAHMAALRHHAEANDWTGKAQQILALAAAS